MRDFVLAAYAMIVIDVLLAALLAIDRLLLTGQSRRPARRGSLTLRTCRRN